MSAVFALLAVWEGHSDSTQGPGLSDSVQVADLWLLPNASSSVGPSSFKVRLHP